MNSVILTGNMCRDPELKKTPNDISYCRFNLAVRYGKKSEFHPLIAWQKTAELIMKYTAKGSKLGITGHVTTRSFDKDGSRRFVTEIVVDSVEFLTSKQAASQAAAQGDAQDQEEDASGFYRADDEEELPF